MTVVRIPTLVAAAALLSVLLASVTALQQGARAFSRREFVTTAGGASISAGSAAVITAAASAIIGTPFPAAAAYIDPTRAPLEVTKRAFLDVQIGDDSKPGRIVIGLYGEAMPRVVENFATLAKSNSYADTNFYRVISGMSVQGGAIGDSMKGRRGKSAFGDGEPFEPDNYNILHSKEGLVSAVRTPDGKCDSRFFIQTTDDGGWADDRYAAFGIVEDGMNFVAKIDKVDVQPPQNGPKEQVKIIKSGLL